MPSMSGELSFTAVAIILTNPPNPQSGQLFQFAIEQVETQLGSEACNSLKPLSFELRSLPWIGTLGSILKCWCDSLHCPGGEVESHRHERACWSSALFLCHSAPLSRLPLLEVPRTNPVGCQYNSHWKTKMLIGLSYRA